MFCPYSTIMTFFCELMSTWAKSNKVITKLSNLSQTLSQSPTQYQLSYAQIQVTWIPYVTSMWESIKFRDHKVLKQQYGSQAYAMSLNSQIIDCSDWMKRKVSNYYSLLSRNDPHFTSLDSKVKKRKPIIPHGFDVPKLDKFPNLHKWPHCLKS